MTWSSYAAETQLASRSGARKIEPCPLLEFLHSYYSWFTDSKMRSSLCFKDLVQCTHEIRHDWWRLKEWNKDMVDHKYLNINEVSGFYAQGLAIGWISNFHAIKDFTGSYSSFHILDKCLHLQPRRKHSSSICLVTQITFEAMDTTRSQNVLWILLQMLLLSIRNGKDSRKRMLIHWWD